MGYCATHKVNYIYNGCYQCKSDRELIQSQAKEIEGLRENINSTNTFITEILDNYEQYSKYGKPACDLLDIIQETLSKGTTQPDKGGSN